jgi:hypothetical protein
MSWLDKYRPGKKKAQPLPPGMHVLRSDTLPSYRLHLRLEENGHGVLIINASTILHLNPTAAEYVYHLVHETPDEEVVREISSRYRVNKKTILKDISELRGLIDRLIYAPNSNPDSVFELEHRLPALSELSAPYRLNCALTDAGATNRAPSASPRNAGAAPSLSKEEWKIILDKAWEAGIPHILFVGSDPREPEALMELIRHCQENGQVAGLVTDGSEFSGTDRLYELLKAGLDHVVLVVPEEESRYTEIIERLTYWLEMLEQDLNIVVHFTLNDHNEQKIKDGLERIREYGVTAVSLTVNAIALTERLLRLREFADQLLLNLVWQLPVPYDSLDPVTLEGTGAGKETSQPDSGVLHIDPYGEVRRTRMAMDSFGNLLTERWETIWAKVVAS